MSLIDKIKKDAAKGAVQIESTEATKLSQMLNKLFYLDKDIANETKFIKMVMTRGAESQERVGLHASNMLVSDSAFCLRSQVLSLVYRQLQGEQISVGLVRLFEEGNSVHEKWQRLFIRGGYSTPYQLDYTQYCGKYKMSFTPDIICTIPDFYDGPMVGEIKSMNTFSFKKQAKHPSAWKQCQWYMHLTGIKKGFVLCEDKNTQDFRVEVYDYDPEVVQPFVDRAEAIMEAYNRLMEEKKMARRPDDAKKPDCKRCSKCVMRDACWNIGAGRVKIGK